MGLSPQVDVSVSACVSTRTSAGLLVRSIFKPLRGLNQAKTCSFHLPLRPYLLSSHLCFRVPWTIAARPSLTAALTLSL